MKNGFLYLVAVMDWYSRYVLSWELSSSMESSFCVKALQTALERFGTPGIFNTDQGVQFTSDAFVDTLLIKTSWFPWTVKAELLITYVSKHSGVASSTKKST